MPITFGPQRGALFAARALERTTAEVSKSFQRLSSGLRINSASDDAAGLSVAAQLSSRARVFAQAIRNVNDGISAAGIAEGALESLRDISIRQLELAEEAANGTFSLKQRQALNDEANALVREFNRITATTTFNGIDVLDPSAGVLSIQAGTSADGAIQLDLTSQLKRAIGNGTVGTATAIGGLSDPNGVTTGDFNGDGKADLLVASYGTYTADILLGNGDGTFLARKANTLASGPRMVATGDFNGDGKLDFATANGFPGFNTSVFIANGDGTFLAAKNYATAGQPRWISTGDINGDGYTDIVTADQTGNDISVLLANSDGSFKAVRSLATSAPRAVVVTDLDGDGKADIVSADTGGTTITAFRSNGDGTFQTVRSYATSGSAPNTVTAGDVNGDGINDIIASSSGTANISVFIGRGDGTLNSAITFAAAGHNAQVLLGDFNGDGLLDLGTADQFVGGISMTLGNGDGTFRTTYTFASLGGTTRGLTIGDFNGDGRPDVVSAQYGAGALNLFLANGGYTTTAAYLNICTQQGAREALGTVRGNLDRINGQLSLLGAGSSRFGIAVSNLHSMTENFLAAVSRIQDVDVAEESARLLRLQILQQAATSILAQANQEPSLAIRLLGG